MSNGISGSNATISQTIAGWTVDSLTIIELRTISALLQSYLGHGNAAQETLGTLRSDGAFGLGLTPPVPPGITD